jgi:chemotaxis protein CheC
VNITPLQLDAFKELVNIGVGRAAAALNEMLESPIVLEVPEVCMISYEDLNLQAGDGCADPDSNFSCVQLGFHGSFSGLAALVFPPASAAKLVASLTGEEPETPGLNGVMAGTLNEVGNIVINCVIGTIGNIIDKPFDFSLPNYLQGRLRDLVGVQGDDLPDRILLVRTHFTVQDRHVDGNILLVFEAASFDALLKAIDRMYV